MSRRNALLNFLTHEMTGEEVETAQECAKAWDTKPHQYRASSTPVAVLFEDCGWGFFHKSIYDDFEDALEVVDLRALVRGD